MTGLEIFQIAALVVGVGTPVGTLIYQQGFTRARLAGIEEKINKLLCQENRCKETRERVESDLHGRITDLATEHFHLAGKVNGARP